MPTFFDHLAEFIDAFATNDPTSRDQRTGRKSFARPGRVRQSDLVGGGIKSKAMRSRDETRSR